MHCPNFRNQIIGLLLAFISLPGLAYAQNAPAPPNPNPNQTEKVLTESVETLKQNLRPDWVSLFLLWYRTQLPTVSNGLSDPVARNSFMNMVGCDLFNLYSKNEVVWPRQEQIILEHVNKATLRPVRRFRMLMRAPLGIYNQAIQAFTFTPVSGHGFNIDFPQNLLYGVDSNCENMPFKMVPPWPGVFQIIFTNPEMIQTLPVPKEHAGALLQQRRDDKGEIDRNIYMDIELDIERFEMAPKPEDQELPGLPWIAYARALRAVAYENEPRTVVVGQWGFANNAAAAAGMAEPPVPSVPKH